MKEIQRIIVLIMDSVGIGYQPDAARYDSVGANTFYHATQAHDKFQVPNLENLGIGNITGVIGVSSVVNPKASYGKMTEMTSGNDTFAGVWEMAGVIFTERFESFKPSIPDSIVMEMQTYIGTETLCNSYISGFRVIDEYADEHFASASPIVYTCDDGVVLIAAHEEVIAPESLREIANKISQFFVGKKVSRVIARPFVGKKGNFIRTSNRCDFIVSFAKGRNHLFERIRRLDVVFTTTQHLTSIIGKEFVTEIIPGIKNTDGVMDDICDFLTKNTSGVSMFVLPDFDMSGHRKKPKAYAEDLMSFDFRLGEVLNLINQQDVLIITADHGCDPTLPIRGHTREYVPLLVTRGWSYRGQSLGARQTFSDIGQTICDLIDAPPLEKGQSFADLIS